jgi:hypothetical protein
MAEVLTEESSIKIEDNPIYEAPYNRFILANIQLITNGLEIANGSMKIFNDSLLKFLKFNMTDMRMFWIPFLSSPFIPCHC